MFAYCTFKLKHIETSDGQCMCRYLTLITWYSSPVGQLVQLTMSALPVRNKPPCGGE